MKIGQYYAAHDASGDHKGMRWLFLMVHAVKDGRRKFYLGAKCYWEDGMPFVDAYQTSWFNSDGSLAEDDWDGPDFKLSRNPTKPYGEKRKKPDKKIVSDGESSPWNPWGRYDPANILPAVTADEKLAHLTPERRNEVKEQAAKMVAEMLERDKHSEARHD